MTYIPTQEQKRYLRSFIFLTLLAIVGLLFGLYLYEYGGVFSEYESSLELVHTETFDVKELLLLFLSEARLPALLFLFGFTLFAPFVATAIVLYRGFITGVSVLYFGMYCSEGNLNRWGFILLCICFSGTLILYVITGAKSTAYSGGLRYAAPEPGSLLTRRESIRYIVTFLVLLAFLLGIMALKYTIPIVKGI